MRPSELARPLPVWAPARIPGNRFKNTACLVVKRDDVTSMLNHGKAQVELRLNGPPPRSDRTEGFRGAGSYADAAGAFGLIGVVVEVGARCRDLEPMDFDSAESDVDDFDFDSDSDLRAPESDTE